MAMIGLLLTEIADRRPPPRGGWSGNSGGAGDGAGGAPVVLRGADRATAGESCGAPAPSAFPRGNQPVFLSREPPAGITQGERRTWNPRHPDHNQALQQLLLSSTKLPVSNLRVAGFPDRLEQRTGSGRGACAWLSGRRRPAVLSRYPARTTLAAIARRKPESGPLVDEDRLAVVAQLGDGFVDVGERVVVAVLLGAG